MKSLINFVFSDISKAHKKDIYTFNIALIIAIISLIVYFTFSINIMITKGHWPTGDVYRLLFIPILSLISLLLLKFGFHGFSKSILILGSLFIFSYYSFLMETTTREAILLHPIIIITLSAFSFFIFKYKKERIYYIIISIILFVLLMFFNEILSALYPIDTYKDIAKDEFFIIRIVFLLIFIAIDYIIYFSVKVNDNIENKLDIQNQELEKSRSNLLNQNIQLKQFQNEILNQNEELKAFTEELQAKNELIELKNQNLNVNYLYTAELKEMLQNDVNQFFKSINSSFVCDRSISQVASNLFWVKESQDHLYFILADIKGKSGASSILSVLILKLLNDVFNEKMSLSDILESVYRKIRNIHQKSLIINTKVEDIIDITLCRWSKKEHILKVLTVNQKLLLKQDDQLIEVRSKLIESQNNSLAYSEESVNLSEGSIIYLFTNSCANQLAKGGSKKLRYIRFKELIDQNKDFSLTEQEINIKTFIEGWRGNQKQSENMKLIALKLY